MFFFRLLFYSQFRGVCGPCLLWGPQDQASCSICLLSVKTFWAAIKSLTALRCFITGKTELPSNIPNVFWCLGRWSISCESLMWQQENIMKGGILILFLLSPSSLSLCYWLALDQSPATLQNTFSLTVTTNPQISTVRISRLQSVCLHCIQTSSQPGPKSCQ